MIIDQLLFLTKFAATMLGSAVFFRCIGVLMRMNYKTRREHYVRWLGFGLSNCLLVCASAGAIVTVWSQNFSAGHLLWLTGAGGWFVFDRRPARHIRHDPDATQPDGIVT